VWPKPSEMNIFVASSANQDWLIPNQSWYKKAWKSFFPHLSFIIIFLTWHSIHSDHLFIKISSKWEITGKNSINWKVMKTDLIFYIHSFETILYNFAKLLWLQPCALSFGNQMKWAINIWEGTVDT
jgi:hypothetical protein